MGFDHTCEAAVGEVVEGFADGVEGEEGVDVEVGDGFED